MEMIEQKPGSEGKLGTSKVVFMFSGQGSQKPGMGLSLLANPLVQETFECASEAFGFDIVELLRNASQEQLNETHNAQAAIVSLSIAIFRALTMRGIQAYAHLGFSLGQVSGLYASGIMSLDEVFEFARYRAELMAEAVKRHPGAMCALLGADEESADSLCASCAQGEILVPANYNSPSQIVISGTKAAIARASDMWKSQKKKAVLLATEGAFHSPLMQEAATQLEHYLQSRHFNEAHTLLIANNTALPFSVSDAPHLLSEHLTQPVRFYQSVEYLHKEGADSFIELGYGGVLKGLVKRSIKGVDVQIIDNEESLSAYVVSEMEQNDERNQ